MKRILVIFLAAVLAGAVYGQDRKSVAVWNPDGIELVYVEGNSDLPGFYIGKFEVTQAQWKAIMGGQNPSNFKGDNLPVENVSWNDCQEFIWRLNAATGRKYALPTDAQWVYAAGGGSTSKGYEYSGSNNINDVAWYKDNSGERTHPVGTKLPNELGIYDMTGNAREWCEDWYDSNKSYRVNRGGSWSSNAAYCRVAYRNDCTPGYRFNFLGFRVALVPEP